MVVVAVGLTLTGCGGDDGENSAEEPAPTTTTTTVETTPTVDPAVIEARRLAAECRDGLADLSDELSKVDSRLSVGLTQSEFNTALGDVQIAYDRSPFQNLDEKCLRQAGLPLGSAFNAYLQANTKWADCINDTYCEVEGDVLSDIRSKWSEATRLIAKSERALTQLRSP